MATVTALTFLQLIVQFLLQRLLATCFGAGREMDALRAALNLPIVISTILSGSLGLALIPVFAERLATAGEGSANALASRIGLYLLGLAGAASCGVALCAQPLAAALSPGFSSGQQALAGELLRILSLLVVANCLVSLLNALYHCWRRFAAPAAAGVAGTLATVAYVSFWQERQGIHAAAVGIVVGGATTAALLLPLWLPTLRSSAVWRLAPDPALRRCLILLAPLVLGAFVLRLGPLVDQYLSSYLPAGSLAQLGFAWQLTSALMLLATSGLSIVSFPTLAAHAAAGQGDALNAEIAHALRFLVVLLVPVSSGLWLFCEPVVQLLFEGGAFTPRDTQAVAWLLALYLGAVSGASFGDLLARAFYTLGDTRTPILVGIVGFVVAVACKCLLVSRFGAASIALVTSLSFVLNSVAMAVILCRRLGSGVLAGIAGSLWRSAAAAAVACLAAGLVNRGVMALLPPAATFAVPAAALAGAATYGFALWALGDEFALRLRQFLGAAWPASRV